MLGYLIPASSNRGIKGYSRCRMRSITHSKCPKFAVAPILLAIKHEPVLLCNYLRVILRLIQQAIRYQQSLAFDEHIHGISSGEPPGYCALHIQVAAGAVHLFGSGSNGVTGGNHTHFGSSTNCGIIKMLRPHLEPPSGNAPNYPDYESGASLLMLWGQKVKPVFWLLLSGTTTKTASNALRGCTPPIKRLRKQVGCPNAKKYPVPY